MVAMLVLHPMSAVDLLLVPVPGHRSIKIAVCVTGTEGIKVWL